MADFDYDVCVIGAGVMGIAIARECAISGYSTLLIDKCSSFGTTTSARNSEVIHSGLYYETGSNKHIFCLEGKKKLYSYLENNAVPHRKIGKAIVATSERQISNINELMLQGVSNGIQDLLFLSKNELRKIEPNVTGYAAILSPTTGIMDSHKFMIQMLADFENNSGNISFKTEFESASKISDGWLIKICGIDDFHLKIRVLINAAGHTALRVGRNTESNLEYSQYENYFVKGSYFSLMGPSPFRRLIYPIPSEIGLGIHSTIDLGGATRFGPDTQVIDLNGFEPQICDYSVDEDLRQKFTREIKRYFPAIDERVITPNYSGIRPKIKYNGSVIKDFIIRSDFTEDRGYVELMGIESPGLTSCLAISEHIIQSIFGK